MLASGWNGMQGKGIPRRSHNNMMPYGAQSAALQI